MKEDDTIKGLTADDQPATNLSDSGKPDMILARLPILEQQGVEQPPNTRQFEIEEKKLAMEADKLELEKRKGIVDHLSKEIISQSEHAMTWRTRIAFAAWVGPFAVLGGYFVARKDTGIHPRWDTFGVIALFAAAISFLLLGHVLAEVERHTWNQCNKWRMLIARLSSGEQKTPQPKDIVFEQNLRLGYWLAAIMMLAIFGAVTIAVFRLLL